MADESVFDTEPDAPMVWMQHAEHHGKAQFPAASVEQWRVRGWEPCEAPADVDPALAEHVPLPEPPAPKPPAEVPAAVEPAPARRSTKGVSSNG